MLLAVYIGWNIIRVFLRKVSQNWMVAWPMAFVVGTLIMTWSTYFIAYIFREQASPLGVANGVTMTAFSALAVWFFIRNRRRKAKPFIWNKMEIWVAGGAFIFATFLMIYTFYVRDGLMVVGRSVFSDFSSHLPLIRSFSRGANFPTQFPLFPDGDMRYHFMFQFLVGNLEYLGMRIDWAFNIPSILGLTGAMMALYALAVAITGRKAVGLLAVVFFVFRSSFAFFTFISEIDSLGEIWANDAFIGNTRHEDWGLWNQNVYANQRHLAFGLILLFAVIMEMLPLMRDKIREVWVGRDAWAVEDWWRCIGIGIVVGGLAYWNGAVVLAVLMVLAIMAIFAVRKLEFAVIAAITFLLTMMQSGFFVPSGASLVEFNTQFGFIAGSPTLAGVMAYYTELLGFLLAVVLVGCLLMRGWAKWGLALAFFMPLVFATTVSLTPDVVVNHKYVMIAAMLLNIFAAYAVCRLWSKKWKYRQLLSVLLVFALIVTGIVDMITVVNINRGGGVVIDDATYEIEWFRANTGPRDIILMREHTMDDLVQAGRPIFQGWPYFAWSAGYDTFGRDQVIAQIYGARDIDVLRGLLERYGIAYVVIDDAVRTSPYYEVNEAIFRENFELVVEFGNRQVYRVGLL